MKVVLLTTEFSGGMAHYCENLARALSRVITCEIAAVSAAPGLSGGMKDVTIRLGAADSKLRHRILEKYNPRYYDGFAEIVRSHAPDIVHITAPCPGLGALVAGLKRRKLPTVYTVHDPTPHPERLTPWGTVFRVYQQAVQLPRVMRDVDGIHVHSERHIGELVRLYGAGTARNAYAIHHGIGIAQSICNGRRRPPEMDALSREIPTALFFGRVEAYKGLATLLDAAAMADTAGVRLNLVVAGGGEWPRELPSLRNINLIVINRFIDDDEIRSIFEDSNFVVLPYIEGSQSGVLCLALAFGRPVIVSRVGSLDEIASDAIDSTVLAPGDARALAAALARFAGDREMLRRMSENALKKATDDLSWPAVAVRHINKYQEILDRGQPLPAVL